MGGACSQKLLPWRGVAILSGAQQIFGSLRSYQLYRRVRTPAPVFPFLSQRRRGCVLPLSLFSS